MSENKDFLGSIAKEAQKKPASFQEERVERINKPNPFNLKTIGAVVVALAVIGAAVYFIFLRPNITMQNFVGRNVSEFTAWAKQNGVINTGVLVEERYNFDVAKDIIVEQDVAEGTKIRKDTKITLVVSKGANPDELVTFADLKNMTSQEIDAWISENKLLNTRVTSTYDNTVPEGQVISYELRNIEESAFTRGATLSIIISRGVKPAATITVTTDYVDQPYTSFKSWADTNKLVVDMKEAYDSKIIAGNIVSISVKKDDKVKEGDTITVVVSKGQAVKMIYLDKYTQERVADWATANRVTVRFKEVYHATIAKGVVVYQSITANTVLKDEDILTVGISLGKPTLPSVINKSIDALKNEISDLNEKGANLSINPTYSYEISNTVAVGNIIRISNLGSLTVGTKLDLVISEGKNILLVDEIPLKWADVVSNPNGFNETQINELCTANAEVTCNITYRNDADVANSHIISIARSDGKTLEANTYIKQIVTIDIVICDKNS